MSTVPCINERWHIEQDDNTYDLNITARAIDPLGSTEYAAIITRTVKLWLYVAKAIHNGLTALPEEIAYRSVEMSLEETEVFKGFTFEQYPETRCTVFDCNRQINLTLHSNSLPQAALDLWWAMHNAKTELAALYPSLPVAPQATPASAAPPQGMNNTHNAPAAPQNGVFVANRAPNSNRPDYAEGQLVSFEINKIVVGTHDSTGSVTFKLWGPLGNAYALKTIFMTSKGGQQTGDYKAAASVLESLDLSLTKNQVEGRWQLIVRAAHKDGKEYLNVVSLTAI